MTLARHRDTLRVPVDVYNARSYPPPGSAGIMQSHTPSSILNIAAYKFITIDDAAALRPSFMARCEELALKGTILLTPEGINLFLAGVAASADSFLSWLRSDPRFADIVVKRSISASQPFNKMLVKLKAEIITMKMPLIQPEKGRAPAVDPTTLKRWLDQGHDDAGKPVVMLDTRNAFEVDAGTFDNTIDFRIDKFSEFPAVVAQHRDELAGKTVVTFCTGGIRCEKAAIHMQKVGFDSVLQLEGGILNYFEAVGGAHYHGDCFVFDQRTVLNPALVPADAVACAKCGATVTPREQLSAHYRADSACERCTHS